MSARVPEKLASRRAEISRLCEQLGVRRLELFGSASTGAGASARDFDFLVDLGDLAPRAYADAYFRERVEQEKTLLYAA